MSTEWEHKCLDIDRTVQELKAWIALDCGDHSCRFALDRTGQRTNGGCRCPRTRSQQLGGAADPARALALALAVREASRALTALYLELPEVIVSDVKEKVTRAFAAYDKQLDAVRRDTWEAAAKMIEAQQNQWTGLAGYSAEQAALVIAYKCRQQGGGG